MSKSLKFSRMNTISLTLYFGMPTAPTLASSIMNLRRVWEQRFIRTGVANLAILTLIV